MASMSKLYSWMLLALCVLLLVTTVTATSLQQSGGNQIPSLSPWNSDRNLISENESMDKMAAPLPSSNTTYIFQSDISTGTYHITQPGTYILSENIRFDFIDTNIPSNEYNDDDQYDVGIMVEADDVVIDLNGYLMEMTYPFYLQQRQFTLIQMGSASRNNNDCSQDTDNTDSPSSHSSVIIQNGVLGLTSYHAISGDNINELLISNIEIANFDVIGVECNGCSNIEMNSCNIGPQNTNIPVLARYSHSRSLVPKLRDIANNYGSESVHFTNRNAVTVDDLIHRLVTQMDMVYDHVVHGVLYEEDDMEWQAAWTLFINPSGMNDRGASYGVYLNGHSTCDTDNVANGLVMDNVEIAGIYANPMEKLKISTDSDEGETEGMSNSVSLLFGDTIDIEAVFDDFVGNLGTRYNGDAYTDLMFAIDLLTKSTESELKSELECNPFTPFIFNEKPTGLQSENLINFNSLHFEGSYDINLESISGAIGIRLNGIENVKLQQCSVHNVENWGSTGSIIPFLSGMDTEGINGQYIGNRAMGLLIESVTGTLEDVEVVDIESHSGNAHGILLQESTTGIVTNIRTRNIVAGSQMTQRDVIGLTLPNRIPLSCSVEVRGENSDIYAVDGFVEDEIMGHFIVGWDLCTDGMAGKCEWCFNRNIMSNEMSDEVSNDENPDNEEHAVLVEVASDCSHLPDGLQWILPDDTIGTVIPVICDNGWTMLNGALSESITDYFTSYSISHRDPTLLLPNTDDHTSWRRWFIPSTDDMMFRVAADCTQCVGDNAPDTMWGDSTAYYATGDYLCFYIRKTDNLCSVSEIYCNQCDDEKAKRYTQSVEIESQSGNNSLETYEMWQQCKYVRYHADVMSDPDHYMCTHREPFVWPALGMDGTGCTCYKPQSGLESEGTAESKTYTVPLSQAMGQFVTESLTEDIALETASEYVYVELSQQDFMEGTYRIIHPGTYVVTEDIIFDFNAPPDEVQQQADWSPNEFMDNGDIWWWPRKDQEEQYPGASTYFNPYTLGFFAGISVETSDVVLDLNGFTLRMSDSFYLQQRFFSLIELANRPFAPGKGAANWGWVQKYASNVVVKDGHLGLTSHHCLHGNFLNNVLVENVTMSQFDVAGFGCGQCIKVTLRDLDVGPQHQSIPVLGRYTHARCALPRLYELRDSYGEYEVPFWDRSPTISSLVDRLIHQMDLTFDYVVHGIEVEPDDEQYDEWLAAKRLFINDVGYQDASASYGIVFAGGAAVSAIGTRIENEGDITISNVNVHGLRSHVLEKYKVYGAGTTVTMRGFFRDTFDWEAMTDDFSDLETAKYVGNAWEDIMMAVVIHPDLSREWSLLYTAQIEQFVIDWVTTGNTSLLERHLDVHCGTDIQVHSVKGAIGVRVDGADSVEIRNVTISDVASTGDLGSMRCGEYVVPQIAGESAYIQPGYNGHRAHGMTLVYSNGVIEDVAISEVSSLWGSAYGLRVFDGCDLELKGTVMVNGIVAGTVYEENNVDMRFMMKSTVNALPQACSVYLYSDGDDIHFDGNTTISAQNVVGYRECEESVLRAKASDSGEAADVFVAQVIGECVDCVVKEVYVPAERVGDTLFVRHQQSETQNRKYFTATMTTIVAAVFVIIVFAVSAVFKSRQFQQIGSGGTTVYGGELLNVQTPLLKAEA